MKNLARILTLSSPQQVLVVGVLAVLVAAAATVPSFAAPPRGKQQSSTAGFNAANPRDRAIHDCNVEASKWSMIVWQSAQIQVYRECMAEHGQLE